MSNRPLSGYPQPVGKKYEEIYDHDGPVSYNNTGTFSTSGETVNASDLGFGGFDSLGGGGLSSDGLNTVVILLNNNGNGNAVPSATIHWIVQATGAEVANGVNLSGKSIRLTAKLV